MAGGRRGRSSREVDDWLPSEIAGDARDRSCGLVKITLEGIDYALDVEAPAVAHTPAATELTNRPPYGRRWARRQTRTTPRPRAPTRRPAEDSGEELSSQRAGTKLLDRLLYKGVLPRYAFPTDVVSFHIFDEDRSTPYRPVFQYAPSQGLTVALSQYAPGKVVWVDKQGMESGALYSPMREN